MNIIRGFIDGLFRDKSVRTKAQVLVDKGEARWFHKTSYQPRFRQPIKAVGRWTEMEGRTRREKRAEFKRRRMAVVRGRRQRVA